MEISSVDENVKLLMNGLSVLIRTTPEGGEDENSRWSKILEGLEMEVHNLCNRFYELRNGPDPNNLNAAEYEFNKEVKQVTKYLQGLQECVNLEGSQAAEKPKIYLCEELESFTTNFSIQIGSGGFAKVYKGQFSDGVAVAVKVLEENDFVQDMFISELSTICRTSHPYLVKLHGYCFNKKMKALLYEYMEKGSFDKILYDNPHGLDWNKFYEIAIKIAEGLSYLHHDCPQTIIHYDVKPANVLIDSNLSPKIIDFGLSKFLNKNLTHRTNTGMKGTQSFVAPEVFMPWSPVSSKCDVYSFGMLLFEIVGMKPIGRNKGWFPTQVWENLKAGKLNETLERCGISAKNSEDAEIVSMVALWCIQFKPTARPSMCEVVKMLKKEIILQSPPHPIFAQSLMPTMQQEVYQNSSAFLQFSQSSVPTPSSSGESSAPTIKVVYTKSSPTRSDESLVPTMKEVYTKSSPSRSGESSVPTIKEAYTESSPSRSGERLEEKLSNLESENQVLRQQALAISPTGKTLALRPKSTIIQRTPENGHMRNGEARHISDMSPAVSGFRQPESEERPQKSLNEKLQENQDLLIKCISQDLGFSGGRPVAACLIYKCLLHWRSFEVERTTVFDRIIQTISSALEVQEENDTLSYWLSNSSTLLLLLLRTLKASGAASLTPQRRRTSASLFGRMSQELRGSRQSAGISFLNGRMLAGLDDLRQVEARYPALLFKQQLTAFLQKIYGMIRDNLKKEISPMIALCIQAPRASRASLVKGSRSQANAVEQALVAHWQSIVKVLDTYLKTLRANYVSPFLVRKVFTQIFSFFNVQVFNSLLLRRECCSFSNGELVESGLAELEQWCIGATEEYAGSAWDELRHIRQAVGFLVTHQKPKKTLNEITIEVCPVLSIQQLYRISTMFWDDKYGTQSVSKDVISTMRFLMTEDSSNAVSSSFLLDDDSSIPFTVDDISKSMQQIDIADIDPPPLLREDSEFVFLLQRAH